MKFRQWQMAFVFWKNKWPVGQDLLVVLADLKKVNWKDPEVVAFQRGWSAAFASFSTEMLIFIKEHL